MQVQVLCAHADTLLDNLTVEEMLMYTAEMKNPVRESLATKKAKVALVLEQLALMSYRNVKIGNALDRGISGCSLNHPASSETLALLCMAARGTLASEHVKVALRLAQLLLTICGGVKTGHAPGRCLSGITSP